MATVFLLLYHVMVDMTTTSVLGWPCQRTPSITNYIDNGLFVGVGTGIGGGFMAGTTKLFV